MPERSGGCSMPSLPFCPFSWSVLFFLATFVSHRGVYGCLWLARESAFAFLSGSSSGPIYLSIARVSTSQSCKKQIVTGVSGGELGMLCDVFSCLFVPGSSTDDCREVADGQHMQLGGQSRTRGLRGSTCKHRAQGGGVGWQSRLGQRAGNQPPCTSPAWAAPPAPASSPAHLGSLGRIFRSGLPVAVLGR